MKFSRSALLLLSLIILKANAQYFPNDNPIAYVQQPDLSRPIDKTKPVYSIPGAAAVSNGSASYSIPIHVPKGINGQAPSLAVTYNSGAGVTDMGIGWSLQGASAITLSHLNHVMNGKAHHFTLNYDATANLSLDGQPLVLTSGAQLQPGSTYRTLNESWQKIEMLTTAPAPTNVSGFKVTSKDGTVRIYGSSESTQFLLDDDPSNPGFLLPYAWLLEKIIDRHGNEIRYHYAFSGVHQEYLLEKITYSHNHTEGEPVLSPTAEVRFSYKNRLDQRSRWLLENQLFQTILLTEITTYNNQQEFSKYQFNYSFETGTKASDYSRLVEIKYWGLQEEVISTLVDWKDAPQFEATYTSSMNIDVKHSPLGRIDFCTDNINDRKINMDLDGDGIEDLLTLEHAAINGGDCHVFGGGTNTTYDHQYTLASHINAGNGTTFTRTANIAQGISNWKPDECEKEPFFEIYGGDFNGDGLSDFILHRCEINNGNQWYVDVYINNNSNPGTFTKSRTDHLLWTLPYGYNHSTQSAGPVNYDSPESKPFRLLVGDFDGDGITDYSHMGSEVTGGAGYYNRFPRWRITYSNPNLTTQVENMNITDFGTTDSAQAGDFNGDGKVDLLIIGRLECNVISVQDGRDHIKDIFPESGYPTSYHSVHVADFNGDGLSDILTYHPVNHVWLITPSNGDGWAPSDDITSSISEQLSFAMSANRPRYIKGNILPRFADFDFDGRADILLVRNTGGVLDAKVYYNKIDANQWQSETYDISASDVYPISGLPIFISQPCTNDLIRDSDLSLTNFTGQRAIQLFYLYGNTSNRYDFTITFRKNNQTDKVHQVLDGFNRLTTFGYGHLTEGASYTRNEYPDYPATTLAMPMQVATSLQQKDFNGTLFTDQRVSYENFMVDRRGLGALGFKATRTEDLINNTEGVFRMRLVEESSASPYSSWFLMPGNMENYVRSTGELTSKVTYVYYPNVLLTHANGKQTYNALLKKERTQNYLLQTSVDKWWDYDTHGNITVDRTFYYDNTLYQAPYTERKVVNFNNYTSAGSHLPWQWQYKQTTFNRDGEPAIVLGESRAYYPNGDLEKKITYPNTTAQVDQRYIYHYTGNLKEQRTYPDGLSMRTNKTNWTTDWRLVQSTENALGWITSYTYHPILDLVDVETDPNGFQIDSDYDNFGRKTQSTDLSLNLSGNVAYAWNTDPAYTEALYKIETSGDNQTVTRKWYDGQEREIRGMFKNQNDDWVLTDKEYRLNGLLDKQSNPYFEGGEPHWSEYDYDLYHRNTDVVGPTSTVQTTYNGLTQTVTNLNSGETKTVVKDAAGKTLTVSDNEGSISYEYYSHGKTRQMSGVGITITTVYDDYGRQLELHDPAAGTILYTYDALGRMLTQTDAINQTYTMSYDLLGRMTSKTGPEGTYEFAYDSQFRGMPDSETSPYGPSKSYQYDSKGRLQTSVEIVEGQDYAFQYTYSGDNVSTITYPNDLQVGYEYDSYGNLNKIKDQASGLSLWEFITENHFGQITEYTLNNNAQQRLYDLVSGLPETETGIWGQRDYDFDAVSQNLLSRSEPYKGIVESFGYNDGPTRLTSHGISTTTNVQYNSSGAIEFKTDVGNYALSDESQNTEIITNNPGTISGERQTLAYTPFNSVATIREGAYDATFLYGPDQQRKKMTIQENWNPYLERVYIGNGLYERDSRDANQWNYAYIPTPTGTEIVYIQDENSGLGNYYFLQTDYLGSLLGVLDQTGNLVEEYHYDPWGNPKDEGDWENDLGHDPHTNLLYRGFTGHEHLWCFGLINMNGRLYDPLLGRMLSPDNFVQNPEYSQNLNRYTYAYNNPLKYTDPDGEIIVPMLIGAAIGVLTNGVNNSINNQPFFQGAGLAALVGGMGGAASFGIGQAAIGMSGFGKVAFQTAMHGHLNGIMSAGLGGTYGQGLLSGSFSSVAATGINSGLSETTKFIRAAGTTIGGGVAGGVASKILGGNFWKGMMGGMISAGLNHSIHSGYLGKDLMMASITGRFRHLLGPDARSYSVEAGAQIGVGVKPIEKGLYHIFRGKHQGVYRFDGAAISAGTPSVSIEATAIDLYYTGNTDAINPTTFTGTYQQASFGIDVGVGISAISLYSALPNNEAVYGIGLGISLDAVPNYLDFTYQYGATTLSKDSYHNNPVRTLLR